jgi:hypothetical protein
MGIESEAFADGFHGDELELRVEQQYLTMFGYWRRLLVVFLPSSVYWQTVTTSVFAPILEIPASRHPV